MSAGRRSRITHSGAPRDGVAGPLKVGQTTVTSVQFFGQRVRWPLDAVYIGMPGAPSRAFGIPDAEGVFGKPWACLSHPLGWETGYLRYLIKRLGDEAFVAAVRGLHGKTLLCWCAAKASHACHGMILAEFAELLSD